MFSHSTPMMALTLLAIAAAPGSMLSPAFASEITHGALKIENPWVRTTIPGRPAAGYMVVRNAGDADDAIVSASAPDAERVELHTHLMENDVMKMRPVEKIDVPAGGSAELKSGGLHLMIFGVTESLKDGNSLPVTVVFEKAGPVKIDFKVKTIAGGNATRGSHSGHDMKKN